MTATGWTLRYIYDEVTFPELQSLMEYWRSNPPTHILMKVQVQFKEPSKTATKNQPQDATELMMMFGMNADGTGVLRG